MPSDLQKAIATADKWFSRYIRLKYSSEGIGFCYTCGASKNILEMDCGHFIGRARKSTRWHEDNARPQCTKCNKYRSGEPAKFRQRLKIDLGESRLDKLESLPDFTKMTAFEVREIGKHYRTKFNELKKVKGDFWS